MPPSASAAFPARPRGQSGWSIEWDSPASRWPSRSSAQNRARCCPESSLPSRFGAPRVPGRSRGHVTVRCRAAPCPGTGPPWAVRCHTRSHWRAASAQPRKIHMYVTSSQPESGADDTEAISGGRWGHLSRLTESSTRVEVTGTTRYDATPRRHRRQTAQSVRARAAHGQAPAEAGSSRSVDQCVSVIRVACHPADRAAASISGAPSLGSP